jgi:hypothetical protein
MDRGGLLARCIYDYFGAELAVTILQPLNHCAKNRRVLRWFA